MIHETARRRVRIFDLIIAIVIGTVGGFAAGTAAGVILGIVFTGLYMVVVLAKGASPATLIGAVLWGTGLFFFQGMAIGTISGGLIGLTFSFVKNRALDIFVGALTGIGYFVYSRDSQNLVANSNGIASQVISVVVHAIAGAIIGYILSRMFEAIDKANPPPEAS